MEDDDSVRYGPPSSEDEPEEEHAPPHWLEYCDPEVGEGQPEPEPMEDMDEAGRTQTPAAKRLRAAAASLAAMNADPAEDSPQDSDKAADMAGAALDEPLDESREKVDIQVVSDDEM